MAYEPGKHRSLEDITGSVVGWVVVFLAWAAQLAFIVGGIYVMIHFLNKYW